MIVGFATQRYAPAAVRALVALLLALSAARRRRECGAQPGRRPGTTTPQAGVRAAEEPAGRLAEPRRDRRLVRTTGGGSAVTETLFPGTAHEMMSVYHMDGDDLVLTHYCAGGNQPRMMLE